MHETIAMNARVVTMDEPKRLLVVNASRVAGCCELRIIACRTPVRNCTSKSSWQPAKICLSLIWSQQQRDLAVVPTTSATLPAWYVEIANEAPLAASRASNDSDALQEMVSPELPAAWSWNMALPWIPFLKTSRRS
jgi:hypothetical protein